MKSSEFYARSFCYLKSFMTLPMSALTQIDWSMISSGQKLSPRLTQIYEAFLFCAVSCRNRYLMITGVLPQREAEYVPTIMGDRKNSIALFVS